MATQRTITMIVPVPVPPEALAMFAAQIPDALRRPDIHIEFVATRDGARILDSHYELTLADAFVLEAGVRAAEAGADAICINSMSDSGLAALRSRLDIPVIGPCQVTFLTACMLGKRFSVLTMWKQWFPLYEKALTEQGLHHRLASIRSIDVRPDAAELLAGKEDTVFAALEEQARRAIADDGADVIVLGSTTMHQSYDYLAERLPVPVLNPGLISLRLCEMFLDLGLGHSKATYPSPEVVNDAALQ
ncbi:MAG: aspartate/glutamate racemase family protein [Sphingomonadales bacterium]